MSALEEIQIKNIDYLGIVAGLIDEIGIVEVINKKLGIDKRAKIGSGQVLKAMILNGYFSAVSVLENGVDFSAISPRA